jgi:hypothetical protein
MTGTPRRRLSYANVMSTLAVFVALGGTSYAVTLPRNSVSREQLRPNSVGSSEIRRQAVGSKEIRNASIELRDISTKAQASLRDPSDGMYFQSVNSFGGGVVGNAAGWSPSGINGTIVAFNRSVANCVAVASITSLPGGPNPDPPGGGQVKARPWGDGDVLVETFDSSGQPLLLPFNLTVAC